MIGEIASGVSPIRFSESGKESNNDVVEDGQHFWRVAHAQLGAMLLPRHVSPMMQPVLNSPMTRASIRGAVWGLPDTPANFSSHSGPVFRLSPLRCCSDVLV